MRNNLKPGSGRATRQITNVLLALPDGLNEKLQAEAASQQRKRHAQIIFILERFFENADDADGKKEKAK